MFTRLFYLFSLFFAIEATVNICIPLHSSDATEQPEQPEAVLNGIYDSIIQKFGNTTEPDLRIDHLDVNIVHPAIDFFGGLDDVALYNILNFEICFLRNLFLNSSYYQFDVFNLTFINLRVEGKYNLTGDLGDFFDLYGDGDFWLEMKNLSIAMVNFTINVDDEICFPIDLEVNLLGVENNFKNFMYEPELEMLFNKVIKAILPESFGILWQEIKDIFDGPLQEEINDIFHHHNVADIFKNVANGNIKTAPYCYYQGKPV